MSANWGDVATAATVAGAFLAVFFATTTARDQREADMAATAFTHLGGGTQRRSAGIAALQLLRARTDLSKSKWRPLTRFGVPTRWERRHAKSLRGEVFRQLIYVLQYGTGAYYAHEAENIIQLMRLLGSEDPVTDNEIKFDGIDDGQRKRLSQALRYYEGACPFASSSSASEQTEVPLGRSARGGRRDGGDPHLNIRESGTIEVGISSAASESSVRSGTIAKRKDAIGEAGGTESLQYLLALIPFWHAQLVPAGRPHR